MMQGTEVQNKCAGNEVVRADQTCISRYQRDTLLDLVEYRLQTRFVGFRQNAKSTFCTSS